MIRSQSHPLPPWIWALAASGLFFILILLLSPVLRVGIFTANIAAASFLAMVGMGQTFPIASGEGGIDLSIPFVMNFCSFVAVKLADDASLSVAMVLCLGVLFGMGVGVVNGLIVTRVRVPPIIATLAVGFIVLTLVQLLSASGETRFPNRAFTDLLRSDVLAVPVPFFATLALGAAATFLVQRTSYGRYLLAVGQSREAATLAGIPVHRTVLCAYVLSGAMAGLCGVLLAASVGSADLELGNPYLLASVGAVVLGGNRIAGGTATVTGTIIGAVLLTLLVAAVTVAGMPLEFQNISRGVVITLVLIVADTSRNAGGGTLWRRLLSPLAGRAAR